MKNETNQATIEDLWKDALKHYDEVSSHACHWSSSIPRAINGYFEMEVKKRDGKMGDVSDGYHTFDELYEFRKLYNAALFNEWAKQEELMDEEDENGQFVFLPKYDVHKSWKHHNGEDCFGGGWFIVIAILPSGQISNHYPAKDWDLFQVPYEVKAKYPFDGHTGKDVLERLTNLIKTY